MDNTEIHYLTYDPEEIFQEMNLAYIQAGGDILYPGDEKEMRAFCDVYITGFEELLWRPEARTV